MSELEDLDWFYNRSTGVSRPYVKPVFHSIMQISSETSFERKLRMLRPLSLTCTACSMCELGRQGAIKNDVVRDPHVFSSMNPTRFLALGQNPGWDELKLGQPFVGAAGKNFDRELSKNGLSRKDFYITNSVKCFTSGNVRPSELHKERCEPFLRMELNLIRPLLVVALGAVAFSQLCPGSVFGDSLKRIVRSEVFDVPVFAVYHPSPLNFAEESRRVEFSEQMRLMCGLVRALQKEEAGRAV